MAKANEIRKASTQKTSRFSIRVSASQKRVIAEAARIKDTTISDFVLEHSLTAGSTPRGPMVQRVVIESLAIILLPTARFHWKKLRKL